MTIYFRVDANSKNGMGHFIRCFSIAQILIKKFNICFVFKETNILLIEKYLNYNYQYQTVKDEYIFLNLLRTNDIVILDGHEFTIKDQLAIKKRNAKLILIDDLIHDIEYADVVINHQLFITDKDYNAKDTNRLCLGAKYLMIREAFILNKKEKKMPLEYKRLFLCLGGVPSFNHLFHAVKELKSIREITKIDILIGCAIDQEYQEIEKFDNRIQIHNYLSDEEVANLINTSDFGIVTASTIAYEALFLKLPLLILYENTNQINFYNALLNVNHVIGIGKLEDINGESILGKILQLKLNSLLTNLSVFNEFSQDNFIEIINKLAE